MEISTMVAKFASAAAVLALAGMASAAPFRVQGVVEASDNPAALGSPLTLSGGTFFQHALGSANPPASGFIPVFAALQYDSYVTIDGNGFSTASYTSNTPGQAIPAHNYFPNGSTLDMGAMFVTGGTGSGVLDYNGVAVNVVAIARLTSASTGATLNLGPDGVFALVRDTTGQDIRLQFTAFDVGVQSGQLFPQNVPGSAAEPYFLIANQYDVTVSDSVTPSTTLHVWDLYVASKVPTPGAAALLGLAGLAGLRRRR